MIPVQTFRNCRIENAAYGELFLADDGEKFIVGRAGTGKLVALMLEGNPEQGRAYYFSDLDAWQKHGVAVPVDIVIDPSSLRRPEAIPPGSVVIDQGTVYGTVYVAGFSGITHQVVAISGDGERPGNDLAAFARWAAVTKDADGKPVELFAFEKAEGIAEFKAMSAIS